MHHKIGIIVTIGTLLVSARPTGADVPDPGLPVLPDPGLRTATPRPAPSGFLRMRHSSVLDYNGTVYSLPPGYFYDVPTWDKLDAGTRALQDQVTRLDAENKSLRTSTARMEESWTPGWKTLTTVLLVGFAGGVYAHYKL